MKKGKKAKRSAMEDNEESVHHLVLTLKLEKMRNEWLNDAKLFLFE